LIFGFEYNKTCQTKNSIYAGHFAHYEDITYTINALKIPLLLRANIGNNITGFADLGFFGDIVSELLTHYKDSCRDFVKHDQICTGIFGLSFIQQVANFFNSVIHS